jgi:tRNA nucleotidyltransferase (CCA-adding enzyme)
MRPDLAAFHIKLKQNKLIKAVMRASDGQAWLVGWFIRDLLISGRIGRCPKDLDFVVPGQPMRLARDLKRSLEGTIVNLREESIVRLVLKTGNMVDISMLEAGIRKDVNSRDFSMNSIAWNPQGGFFDHTGGIKDIASCKIRHLSRKNLIEDPLRLLRAYRFRAETGFRIDKVTRELISRLFSLSCRPAPERITYELIRIIKAKHYLKAIREATDDGVLPCILDLSSDELKENIRILRHIENREGWVTEKWRSKGVGQGLNNLTALRLFALLSGASIDCLSLNRNYLSGLTGISKNISNFKDLKVGDKVNTYNMLCSFPNVFIYLSVITGKEWAIDSFRRYERQNKSPLITARELMGGYGIKEGPAIGRILRGIGRERFLGNLRNKYNISGYIQTYMK